MRVRGGDWGEGAGAVESYLGSVYDLKTDSTTEIKRFWFEGSTDFEIAPRGREAVKAERLFFAHFALARFTDFL